MLSHFWEIFHKAAHLGFINFGLRGNDLNSTAEYEMLKNFEKLSIAFAR